MLFILPAENRLKWRRPPVITLLLITANCLIYSYFAEKDIQRWSQAIQLYHSQQLAEIEAVEYADFLDRRISLENDGRAELALELREAIEEGDYKWVAAYTLVDEPFQIYMNANGEKFLSPEDFHHWRLTRQKIDLEYLQHISTYRFGLYTERPQLANLVSHQFLHADLGHLIGNMLLLFILGFTLESILGRASFFFTYLLSGACAGLIFALVQEQPAYGVGASGAISGLMGAYVAHYRLTKIRFFYFIVFYFNYFKAPALALLPVWIGKELFDFFSGTSPNIAYFAHIGGLISGAAIIILRSRFVATKSDLELAESSEVEVRTQLHTIYRHLTRFEFSLAREKAREAVEMFPGSQELRELAYQVHKTRPQLPATPAFVADQVERQLAHGAADAAAATLLEYYQTLLALSPVLQKSSRQPASSLFLRTLTRCLQEGQLEHALKLAPLIDTVKLSSEEREQARVFLRQATQRSEKAGQP